MNSTNPAHQNIPVAKRFRGFLPVIVDVETAGFNAEKDALLEVGGVIIGMDHRGKLFSEKTFQCHILPFKGANIEKKALEFNGIEDPFHPFRNAKEETKGLKEIFITISEHTKRNRCSRAILVGHNAAFDLNFINAAVKRTRLRSPFHQFSTFDTVSLGGVAYGHTVLAKIAQTIGIPWDNSQAHSALYDAERTADIFCHIVNQSPYTAS
jgi:ribonuclease T